LLAAMDKRGVGVFGLAVDLDVMAQLEAAQINTLGFDRDRNRTFDQLATLTELSAERGVGTTIELAPGMTIGDLRLALDTMHWVRAHTTLKPRLKSYTEEAMYERMAPGDGELPLAEFLAAVPPDVVVGLEIPMRSLAEAGVGPMDRLRPCVAAARQLGCR
jgi:hypothetical protein